MDETTDSPAWRTIRGWLWASTAVCALAPLLLLLVGRGWLQAVALLPVANCLALWAAVWFAERRAISEAMALRLEILQGLRDASTDARVREVRARSFRVVTPMLWAFLLIPFSWLVLIQVSSVV